MMREPRIKNEAHLDFIRTVPCVICENPHQSEAAHIRFACEPIKRPTGKGERPHDLWTLPLCQAHHVAQHEMGEREFWAMNERDPIIIALALWANTGNHARCTRIAREAGR